MMLMLKVQGPHFEDHWLHRNDILSHLKRGLEVCGSMMSQFSYLWTSPRTFFPSLLFPAVHVLDLSWFQVGSGSSRYPIQIQIKWHWEEEVCGAFPLLHLKTTTEKLYLLHLDLRSLSWVRTSKLSGSRVKAARRGTQEAEVQGFLLSSAISTWNFFSFFQVLAASQIWEGWILLWPCFASFPTSPWWILALGLAHPSLSISFY